MLYTIFTLLIVLLGIFGTPLFIIIALFAILNFFYIDPHIVTTITLKFSELGNTSLLYSIPLFTFAGYILAESKASQRLVRLTKAAIGWMPGGLAVVTIFVCSVFTAFTGASGITIVALGGLLLPALLSEKYGEKYSLGLITSSGSFGLLFPPSLPIIMFGVIAGIVAKDMGGVAIKDLFIGGLIPGIFLVGLLSAHAIFIGKKQKVPQTKFSWKELGKALWALKWEIPLPIILFAGIFSGKLLILDAASFTVVYILVAELFLTKDVKIKSLPKIMQESMVLVGAILIIMGVSFGLNEFLTYAKIPQKLFEIIQTFISSKYLFLILLNIFLLIVGSIMDIFSAIIVVVPLILPIAYQYNINFIHLGIVFLANLQIGYITPPVGMNLFIASIRFKKSVTALYKASLIFIGLLLGGLIIITFFPKLSTWFQPQPAIIGQWEYTDDGGDKDTISLKAGGVFERKSGDLLQRMTPVLGKYSVKKHTLTLISPNQSNLQYKYEIYNGGIRLLLEPIIDTQFKKNLEYNSQTTESSEDTDECNDEENTNEPETNTSKKFYKNLNEPLNKTTALFIGNWESDESMTTFTFNFNKTVTVEQDFSEYNYAYKVLDKHKVEFINTEEYSANENTNETLKNSNVFQFSAGIFRYKISNDNSKLELFDLKKHSIKLNLNKSIEE